MNGPALLPAQFAALEPFAPYWSAPTLSERDTRRLDSTAPQRLAFYDAARNIAPDVLAYLDAKAFADYDPTDHRLLDLMLALAHVALAVEVQREDEPVHARGARLMPIVRERADPRTLVATSGT